MKRVVKAKFLKLTLNFNKMADFSWIGGAAGGLLGSISSAISSSKMIKAQKQENALNRQFNADEAQKSRDFELDMFNRTNSYNTPKNVVNRLVDAGLNPALAFGGFQNASFGGNSAAAFSNNGVGSPLPDFTGLSSAGRSYLDAQEAQSRIHLNESEARKRESETDWMNILNQNLDELQKIGIDLSRADLNMKPNEAKLLAENVQIANQTFKNLKTVGLISSQQLQQACTETYYKEIKEQVGIAESIARVKSLFSKANLDDFTAYKLAVLLSYDIAESESRTAYNLNAAEDKAQSAREHSERANLIHFDNIKNEQMRKICGLGHLAKQQYEIIDVTIEDLKNQMGNRDANTVINGLQGAADIGFNVFDRTSKGTKRWRPVMKVNGNTVIPYARGFRPM